MRGPPSTPGRFALALLLPLSVAAAVWHSPWAGALAMLAWLVGLALLERVPALQHSMAAGAVAPWHRWLLAAHVPLQFGLQGLGIWVVGSQDTSWPGTLALAFAVGGVAGSQGITFAHEMGHLRRRGWRIAAWLLMISVSYAHFMVEHYRGHHARAATPGDPATARRGESLWRFLPRVLLGCWRSAWALEANALRRQRQGWSRSLLLWACAAQLALWSALLAWGGWGALLFWLLQSACAVFMLETINYIEHYGLVRPRDPARPGGHGPFGPGHAWSADHALTNCIVANLQRHADHHMNPDRAYPELRAFPGPALPTGYAGCLFLAMWPALWFRKTEPVLAALERASAAATSAGSLSTSPSSCSTRSGA